MRYRNNLKSGSESNFILLRFLSTSMEPTTPENVNITLVKQIPLTEKWLLDFGFKKIEYGCSFEYEIKLDRFSRLTIQDDFSFGLTNLNDDRDLLCFENDIIKSVHRLQNLYFALTGKNLKL